MQVAKLRLHVNVYVGKVGTTPPVSKGLNHFAWKPSGESPSCPSPAEAVTRVAATVDPNPFETQIKLLQKHVLGKHPATNSQQRGGGGRGVTGIQG